MRAAVVLLLLTIVAAACAQVPGARWAGDDAVTFYLDFEDGTCAWKAAGNPWQFGSEFELVDGGLAGQAWRNTSKMGYIGFDGLGSVPLEAGTVSMYLKSGERNIFADGRAHSICALPRTIEGMVAQRDLWPAQGLALALRKTEGNTLDLVAHVGGDEWMWGSEPAVLASTDVSDLAPGEWHHLAFSWDFATRAVWLVVDGEATEGAIPEVIERPHEYLCAIFGNTQEYTAESQQPLDGLLDEIAILSLPWPRARQIMASDAPLAAPDGALAERPRDPKWTAEATLFPDDPDLARCEQVARQHLKMMVQTQRHGGWCLNIKWPSLLQWTARFRMPEPRNMIWLSKDSHTAFAATELLFAYEALGDEQYLQAARNTAEMYLATQDPELGSWIHGYYFDNGVYVPDTANPLIQDHCQTGPLMLLCYMHRVTGEERYLDAAKRSAEFLMLAQNPGGSWPHHWDVGRAVGVGAYGDERGGEVNDYGTSAPIAALLSMYRYSGEERYRQAALRGADWLIETFIDTGTLAGWAGQYDEANQPVAARHFEPPAVTQYAARWAASGLFAAYSVTRDEKYLTPVRRVLEWFDANQVGNQGWWWDYDVPTGRPISMYNREIYFLDDPARVQAYMAVTGSGTPPAPADNVNVPGLHYELSQIEQYPQGRILDQPTQQELADWVADAGPRYVTAYIEGGSPPLNERVGLYTWDSQAGLGTNLVRHQCVRICDLLMRARAARGDIPADNPLFRRIDAFVSWNKILLDYDEQP